MRLENNRWVLQQSSLSSTKKRKYDLLKINRFTLGRKVITIYNNTKSRNFPSSFCSFLSFPVKCELLFHFSFTISFYLFFDPLYNLHRQRRGGQILMHIFLGAKETRVLILQNVSVIPASKPIDLVVSLRIVRLQIRRGRNYQEGTDMDTNMSPFQITKFRFFNMILREEKCC